MNVHYSRDGISIRLAFKPLSSIHLSCAHMTLEAFHVFDIFWSEILFLRTFFHTKTPFSFPTVTINRDSPPGYKSNHSPKSAMAESVRDGRHHITDHLLKFEKCDRLGELSQSHKKMGGHIRTHSKDHGKACEYQQHTSSSLWSVEHRIYCL